MGITQEVYPEWSAVVLWKELWKSRGKERHKKI